MKSTESYIKELLGRLDIEKANAMQKATIKEVTNKKDVMLLSPTGSGKTLAFLLPIVASLQPKEGDIQVLVVAPSRELCLQIEEVFRSLKTGLKVNAFYGGHPIKDEKNSLAHPPAVLIATPGRLADHIRRGTISLSCLTNLVLDEFDKTLEFGFVNEMSAIMDVVPKGIQKVLTSATHLNALPEFLKLKNPVELDYTVKENPSQLRLFLVEAGGKDKLQALDDLLCALNVESSLVFVNHRNAADRISEHLKDRGIANAVFHGGMKQEEREKELFRFRNGSCRILVTTDLASRGLDIPLVKHVIHYQLPHKEDAYIHRNGRTARMEADGNAYVLKAEGETLRDFMPDDLRVFGIKEDLNTPPKTEWETIYLGSGKKDKINKIDIVGFFIKIGGLAKDEIGLINVSDYSALIAVKREKIKMILAKVKDKRIKNKKVKISVAR